MKWTNVGNEEREARGRGERGREERVEEPL